MAFERYLTCLMILFDRKQGQTERYVGCCGTLLTSVVKYM